eukprot:4647069-Pyramimonas_sp.AAC.1
MAPKAKRRRRLSVPWVPGGDARKQQARREAGSELLKHILSLYASAKLSAYDVCVLCYRCQVAEVPGGSFSIYGSAPGKQSGSYQRHLDTVLPGPGDLYMVPTPCNVRRAATRSIRDIPFRPIW